MAARGHEALLEATRVALNAVTPSDAAGGYADCGFPLGMHPL
jgi:hypothetical protein